jgi:hypothetical protein
MAKLLRLIPLRGHSRAPLKNGSRPLCHGLPKRQPPTAFSRRTKCSNVVRSSQNGVLILTHEAARKTLEAIEAPDYPQQLTGTIGAEPVEAYLL